MQFYLFILFLSNYGHTIPGGTGSQVLANGENHTADHRIRTGNLLIILPPKWQHGPTLEPSLRSISTTTKPIIIPPRVLMLKQCKPFFCVFFFQAPNSGSGKHFRSQKNTFRCENTDDLLLQFYIYRNNSYYVLCWGGVSNGIPTAPTHMNTHTPPTLGTSAYLQYLGPLSDSPMSKTDKLLFT